MNRRRNRRWLVTCLYFCLAILCSLVFLQRVPGILMWVTISVLINPLIFGEFLFWGKKRGGILKPFDPHTGQRNDERELAARDLAHFHAYGWLTVVLWGTAFVSQYLPRKYLSAAQLLPLTRNLLWSLAALALTLPQAILLWSEPDVETESDDHLW